MNAVKKRDLLKTNAKKTFKAWQLYVLLIPALLWAVIFAYYPMYGVVIAFKDYKIRAGILGSPWADPLLKYFQQFFSTSIALNAIKNTIVIMTSNIGAHIIQERLKDLNEKNRDQVLETTNNEVYELLKQTIRPEFLNRIDEVIMFTPLQKNEIVDIVRLQVKSLQKMLANNSITIEVTDKAVEWIAQEGYDPQFGARPVKRVIQRNLLNDLSKQILAEKITKDNQIVIDVKDDHIVFTNK